MNLRCWHLCRDGEIVDPLSVDETLEQYRSATVKNVSECLATPSKSPNMLKSKSDATINDTRNKVESDLSTLSKSLGAKHFCDEDAHCDVNIPSDDDDVYEDTEHDQYDTKADEHNVMSAVNNVYVSSAVSIAYADIPKTTKYIRFVNHNYDFIRLYCYSFIFVCRGENLLSCWAMREINGKHNDCIFEWILCIDLKGYFPRYVLDTVCFILPLFCFSIYLHSIYRHTPHLCKTIWSI